MPLAKRIEEVEDQLAEQRVLLTATSARIRGLEAELEALREGAGGGDGADVSEMPRTEAIAAVLRASAETLSPTEILGRLHAAGRTDELRSVTATLDHLVKKGAVQRPKRGRYMAA